MKLRQLPHRGSRPQDSIASDRLFGPGEGTIGHGDVTILAPRPRRVWLEP